MGMVSFCWKIIFLPGKIENNSVLLTMSLKIMIKVVAFFLGHPVYFECNFFGSTPLSPFHFIILLLFIHLSSPLFLNLLIIL